MKLAIVCCLLVALLTVSCRRRKPAATDVSPSEPAAPIAANGESAKAIHSVPTTQSAQAAPTLRGLDPGSDNPLARALAGSDPQAQLKALNELLMVYDQSQGKPLTSPEDFVKAGLISKLPTAPSGMKFSYAPNKRMIELTPAR